jgi:hypothetical protein
MTETEYDRLSGIPFSKMSKADSLTVCAETRRRLAGIKFKYDRRKFEGAHYYECSFLSCVIAGAKIPPQVSSENFIIPRNKTIFQTLRFMESAGVQGFEVLLSCLEGFGVLKIAGGETYIREIEKMIGIKSAINAFALELLRLNLGRVKHG